MLRFCPTWRGTPVFSGRGDLRQRWVIGYKSSAYDREANLGRAHCLKRGGWPVRGQAGAPYAGLACGDFDSSFIFFSPDDLLSRPTSAKLKPVRRIDFLDSRHTTAPSS